MSVEEDEKEGTCGTHAHRELVGKPKGENHLEDLGVDEGQY